MPDDHGDVRRRTVLGAVGASALASFWGCTPGPVPTPRPSLDQTVPTRKSPSVSTTPPSDYATRSAFDWAESRYEDSGSTSATNDSGDLAWGAAYLLQAYLTMYGATGDAGYLEKLVRAGYQVLQVRDTDRRMPDYLGRVQPVWSAESPYTACWYDVRDVNGKPLIRLRSLVQGAEVVAQVRPGSTPSTFNVFVESPSGTVRERFRELSLNPRAPRYAVSFLAASPTRTDLTAVDLRTRVDTQAEVFAERATMSRYRYAFGVHTGMITAPLAGFVATVRANSSLSRQFSGPAVDFLEAARGAIASHNPEWMPYSSRAGVYRYLRDAPVRGDGTPLPHNQYLALARTHLHLHRATGDPVDRARSKLMLQVFLSDLSSGLAPVWPYHWSSSAAYRGYGPDSDISTYTPSMKPQRGLEDTGHGAIDIECLVLGQALGMGPTNAQMTRIATSFLRRIVTESSTGGLASKNSFNVRPGLSKHDLAIPRWAGLAPWNQAIFVFARRLLNQLAPIKIGPQTLASIATLVAHRA